MRWTPSWIWMEESMIVMNDDWFLFFPLVSHPISLMVCFTLFFPFLRCQLVEPSGASFQEPILASCLHLHSLCYSYWRERPSSSFPISLLSSWTSSTFLFCSPSYARDEWSAPSWPWCPQSRHLYGPSLSLQRPRLLSSHCSQYTPHFASSEWYNYRPRRSTSTIASSWHRASCPWRNDPFPWGFKDEGSESVASSFDTPSFSLGSSDSSQYYHPLHAFSDGSLDDQSNHPIIIHHHQFNQSKCSTIQFKSYFFSCSFRPFFSLQVYYVWLLFLSCICFPFSSIPRNMVISSSSLKAVLVNYPAFFVYFFLFSLLLTSLRVLLILHSLPFSVCLSPTIYILTNNNLYSSVFFSHF